MSDAWEEVQDWERWAREVLTDWRVPFDNHKAGLRLGITQKLRDQRDDYDALAARLAEAERLLRETVNGYPMGAANDGGVFVNGGLTGEILVYFALHDEPLRATDSADASPYPHWKCPHCGWDNVDSVCFACKRTPDCDHLWSADDSDGVLLCLRCGHKEPK